MACSSLVTITQIFMYIINWILMVELLCMFKSGRCVVNRCGREDFQLTPPGRKAQSALLMHDTAAAPLRLRSTMTFLLCIRTASAMAKPESDIIEIELPGLKAHGIFKKGREEARNHKPLVVLIHGGGTNATYFDNEFHSSVNTHEK